MLLEALVLGLCMNTSHCNELSRQYFYYNPVLEKNISDTSKIYQDKAKNILGDRIMNGVAPIFGLLIKREATIAFPHNKSIFLKVKTNEIGVNFSYNF